nr:RQC-minor-1 family DNA-binding protein [Oceanobacillus salinisoli]
MGVDKCNVYGVFKSAKMENVVAKIDWMVAYDFLDISYNGKLPMIVFTDRGWEIEANQRTEEFLREWDQWINEGRPIPDMTYLEDRNRHMILLLLEKVKETGDNKYIPYLEAWYKVDYKKVRAAIHETIKVFQSEEPFDPTSAIKRENTMKEALKGFAPFDFRIKCWECGKRFIFTVGEQKFYKQKGFSEPKRCKPCREKRKLELYF